MKICFRFDIDTAKCLQEGVPALCRLSTSFGVPFTFYFNPGRAVSWASLMNRRHGSALSAPKLKPLRKLGVREWLRTSLLNPELRRLTGVSELLTAAESGHEIGLHGGRNHAQWQLNAQSWSREHLESEINWGMNAFRRLHLPRPVSFSSPGWNGPLALPEVLAGIGIHAVADRRSPDGHAVQRSENGPVALISTQFAGEPGGVGFVENAVADGNSVAETVRNFLTQLRRIDAPSCVLYDHPCFAGGEGHDYLRALVEACQSEGVELTTIRDISREVLAWAEPDQV